MLGVVLVASLGLARASQTPAIVVTSFGGIGDAPGAIGTKNGVVREQFKDSNGLATAQTEVTTANRVPSPSPTDTFILTRPDTTGSNDPDEVGPHVYLRTNGQQPIGSTIRLTEMNGGSVPRGGHDLQPIYNPGKLVIPANPGNPANNQDIVIPVTGTLLDAAAYDDDTTAATGTTNDPNAQDNRVWLHFQLCSSRGKRAAWVRPGCGDGEVDANEVCDDGNNINGDGCNSMCGVETDLAGVENLGTVSFCTAVADFGLGATCTENPAASTPNCGCAENGQYYTPNCGNGVMDVVADAQGWIEQCDDGNNVNGDGCSASCTVEQPNSCAGGSGIGNGVCNIDSARSTGRPDLPWAGLGSGSDRHTGEFLQTNAHPFVAHPITGLNEVCDCRCDETTLTATAGAAADESGTGGFNAFTFNWAPVVATDSTTGTWTVRGSELDRMMERVGEADYAVCSCASSQLETDEILGGTVSGNLANIGANLPATLGFGTRQPQPHIVMAGDATTAGAWAGANDVRTEAIHPPNDDFNARDGNEGVFEAYAGLNEATAHSVTSAAAGIVPGISRNLVPIVQVRWGCNADTDCYDDDITRTAPADQRSRNCEYSHREATLPPGIATGTVQRNVPVVPYSLPDGSAQSAGASTTTGKAPGTPTFILNGAIRNPHWERDVANCKLATQCLQVPGAAGLGGNLRSGVCVRPQALLPPQDQTQACGLHLYQSSWGKCCNAGTSTVYPNTVHEGTDGTVTAGLPVFHCPVSHPEDVQRTVTSRDTSAPVNTREWPRDLTTQQACPTGEVACYNTKYDARFPTPPLLNARENSIDWPQAGKPFYSRAGSPDLFHWGLAAGPGSSGSLNKIPVAVFGGASSFQAGYLQPDYRLQTQSRHAFADGVRHDLDQGIFESGALEGLGNFQPLPVPPTSFSATNGVWGDLGGVSAGADPSAGAINGRVTDMVNRVFRCYNPNYEQCCDDGNIYNPALSQCCRIGGVTAVDQPCPCNDDFDCSRPNLNNGGATPRTDSEPNMRCCMQTSPPLVMTTQANLCSRYLSFNSDNGVFGSAVNTDSCMGKCINTDYQICCNGNTCRGNFERCCNTTCCNKFSETCVEAQQSLDASGKAWFWQTNNAEAAYDQCTGIEFLHTVRAFWVYVFPSFLLFGVLAAAAAAITFVSHQATYPLTWSEIILILLATFQGVFALPLFFSPQWKYAAVLSFSAFWAIAVGASRRNYFYLLLVISQLVLLLYLVDPFGGNQYLNFSSERSAENGVTAKLSSGILPSIYSNYVDPGTSTRSPNVNYLVGAGNNDLLDGFNTITGWGTSAVHTPCTTFYNYFLLDTNLLDVDRQHNPDEQFFGYCTRGWIVFLLFMGVLTTVFAFWVFVAALLAVIRKVLAIQENEDQADIVELNIARKLPDYMSSEVAAEQ